MRLVLAALVGALFGSELASAQIETFTLREDFGVSHPRQIIDFDLHSKPNPGKSYLIGPDGAEAPFQLLSGNRLAIDTDLPSGMRKTWKLFEGRASHASLQASGRGIEIKDAASSTELTNGITGIRIPRPSGGMDLAPVQGVRYRDGVWTATGPNYLLDNAEHRLSAKALSVRYIERGPLKTVVELSYSFGRPEDYYRSTIEIDADQPSILIEEDTNIDLRYQFLISPGLDPDEARYRGHVATSVEKGHFADGKVFTQPTSEDAIRKLPFDPPETMPLMAVWDPWVTDSGWYWQFYNAEAAQTANLFGIFAGRTSRALGAASNGAGAFTTNANGKHETGIRVRMERRTPDGRTFPRVRFDWGIFTGVKGEDLGSGSRQPAIARQMNLHAGINLNKIHGYPVDAELKAASKPLYMSEGAVAEIANRVHHDPQYLQYLKAGDYTAEYLLEYWGGNTPELRGRMPAQVKRLAHDLVESLVNGNGIYDFRLHYWMAGLEMSRHANWISAILAWPAAAEEDKQMARHAAVLYGEVLWDDDFVPLFEAHGLNLGTANMPVQQRDYRELYALLLADLPEMRERVADAADEAKRDLYGTVNETGAHMGSTHYLGASMGPLLSNLQQLQTLGAWDAFRSEPRMAAFAEFFMNFLTPPEERFGGVRKFVSIGDAGAESSELYGQLGTGFSKANPDLSARLMWAWRRDGAIHSGFHGTTILKIDESLPMKNPELGDAKFPGWYTVQRNGWETRDETAVWFVNGDFYRDHAHEDNGEVVIYALGAPLSVDWGSLYDPPSSGALMHNAPVPEARIKARWDGELTRENIGFRWSGAKQEAFESLAHSSYVRASFHLADGATWQRSVYSLHPDAAHPVIVIRDRFSGTGAAAAKIVSFNVMASGAVETPAGTVTPPSPSSVQMLGAGLSRFGFMGIAQGGRIAIDADIYTEGPSQALISHWGHHAAAAREQAEYQKANNGTKFEEAQHILRLRGTGEFVTVVLPYRRGTLKPGPVTESGGVITVKTGDETITFDEKAWSFRGPEGSMHEEFTR